MSVPEKLAKNLGILHGSGALAPVLLHPMHRLGSRRATMNTREQADFVRVNRGVFSILEALALRR